MFKSNNKIFFISHRQHESYDPDANGNDLAVIKLKNKVIFDEFVQPVCIPDAYDLQIMSAFLTVNQTAFATGWGQAFGRGYQGLTNYEMLIFKNSDCMDVLRSKGDLDGVICAGDVNIHILESYAIIF